MQAEIRHLPNQQVVYVRRQGLDERDFSRTAMAAFDVLMPHLDRHGLLPRMRQCLGICPDDPDTTALEACRYDAGVILEEGVEVPLNEEVQEQTLAAGKWAVIRHIGPYTQLAETWGAAYRDWLPASGEQLRDCAPYEVYLDDKDVAPEKARTDIYLPLK